MFDLMECGIINVCCNFQNEFKDRKGHKRKQNIQRLLALDFIYLNNITLKCIVDREMW